MRLWTLHPRYLDRQGLLALWREGLLARCVLAGKTRGYRHHPQLLRFKDQANPLRAVNAYLSAVCREADRRHYAFDRVKIRGPRARRRIVETRGQLMFEWRHLRRKLKARSPDLYRELRAVRVPDPHPLFRIVPGPVRRWERGRR